MKVKKLNCPNCSAKINNGQTSCGYCGTMLDFEENANIVTNIQILPTIQPQPIYDTIDSQEPTSTTSNDSETTAETEISDAQEIANSLAKKRKPISKKQHRITSIIVSALIGIAGITSGIILIDRVNYIGIALIALGILCLCKIFYTFMRSSYNMTPTGYIYSGIICALISGFGIYGGVELLRVSPTLNGKLMCIIPFLLALVSLTYFITKTIYYIISKKSNKTATEYPQSTNS